jgi:CelD/BcsL family acetyltransferase involved in cellulose biosynthesis
MDVMDDTKADQTIAADATATSLRVVSDPKELEAWRAEWDELAAAAGEPNAFYESWMLLPALQHFGAGRTPLTVLVFAGDPQKSGSRRLLGLFPLERQRRTKGLPVARLELWKHKHCFLTTPLLRAGHEREALAAFFGWLASDACSTSLLELTLINGEGPCHQALIDELYAGSRPWRTLECYTRALLRRAADADACLGRTLSGKHRRKIQYKERQLAAQGRVEYDVLVPGGDVDAWIEGFLAMEAGGWKGREGSALALFDADRAWFRQVAADAFQRGRLRMLALRLDGRAIAYKCDFLGGRAGFTFKMTYDERYARHSPGLLLEVAAVRQLHEQSQIDWVDSCTHPLNDTLNRLWSERRTVASLLVASGGAPGELVVASLPLLAWLRRRLSRRRPASGGEGAE